MTLPEKRVYQKKGVRCPQCGGGLTRGTDAWAGGTEWRCDWEDGCGWFSENDWSQGPNVLNPYKPPLSARITTVIEAP